MNLDPTTVPGLALLGTVLVVALVLIAGLVAVVRGYRKDPGAWNWLVLSPIVAFALGLAAWRSATRLPANAIDPVPVRAVQIGTVATLALATFLVMRAANRRLQDSRAEAASYRPAHGPSPYSASSGYSTAPPFTTSPGSRYVESDQFGTVNLTMGTTPLKQTLFPRMAEESAIPDTLIGYGSAGLSGGRDGWAPRSPLSGFGFQDIDSPDVDLPRFGRRWSETPDDDAPQYRR